MSKFAKTSLLALALLSALPALRAEETPEKPSRHSWHWKFDRDRDTGGDGDCHSTFAWQAQFNLPTKELGQALDNRSGLGLGLQWNHDHGHRKGHVHRTRLEWNVFPESHAVGLGEVKTKASNYVLSFDRLYYFSGEAKGAYLLGGLGGVRWFLDQTSGQGPTRASHTTKLAVTAGAGYRFNPSFSVETRYLLSSLQGSFDGSMAQIGLNMRF